MTGGLKGAATAFASLRPRRRSVDSSAEPKKAELELKSLGKRKGSNRTPLFPRDDAEDDSSDEDGSRDPSPDFLSAAIVCACLSRLPLSKLCFVAS